MHATSPSRPPFRTSKGELVDQPTSAPTRKVTAGAASGITIGTPLAVIIVWMWNASNPDKQMPAEVGSALGALLGTIASFVAAYMTRNRAIDGAPGT